MFYDPHYESPTSDYREPGELEKAEGRQMQAVIHELGLETPGWHDLGRKERSLLISARFAERGLRRIYEQEAIL